MYFLGLAADYDGTIAQNGAVNTETLSALRMLKGTGRRLILATGRELANLKHAFPAMAIFDLVVAENGAVIYDPATEREHVIAQAPPAAFIQKLLERKVEPLSVGHAIVATWEPHQNTVLEVIQELGLELQITFNKGAVMVLPPGVNKASGLSAALKELDISAHNVVAVGDAENDHSFLRSCGCSAAVANALQTVRDEADIRLSGDHGAGVVELVHRIIRDDAHIAPRSRLAVPAGVDRAGETVYLEPYRNALVVGASGSGKSQFAKLLTERMVDKQLEFCVIDPEGDYHDLQCSIAAADGSGLPRPSEVVSQIRRTGVNAVVNIWTLSLPDRQRFFSELLPCISSLRARTGRPHWLIVDEAHQVLPAANGLLPQLPDILPASMLITVYPEAISLEALKRMDVVFAFGHGAPASLAAVASQLGISCPLGVQTPTHGEALFWPLDPAHAPRIVKIEAPRQAHRRHKGKYATGDVGEWHSFYFRSPDNTAVPRAKNVLEFLEIARQVDDATWERHLRAKDYSTWFRDVIKDEELAHQAARIEEDASLAPHQSRELIEDAVRQRYSPAINAA